ANPAFAATITGLVNGDRQNQVVSGSPAITTAAVASSPAGIYDIVPAQGTLALLSTNYYLNYVNGKLTVSKVNLTVVAQNATRAYGASNPVFTANYTGFVNGDTYATSGITGQPAFTTTATATSGVGNYTLTPSLGTLSSTNYNFTSFTNGTLTISKAALTVAADNKSRFYGSANPALTYRYVGFVNGDSTTTGAVTGTPTISTTALNTSTAGSYPITMGAGNLASVNYAITVSNGTLTVNKALLTVTARDSSRAYGAANPTFGYTLTGYVLGQSYGSTSGVNGIPSVTSTATPSSSAATTWPITPSLGTLTATNYDFVFVDGKLTITKGNVFVTADPKTRGYGNANPAFTATFTGFVNGETLATSDITGSPAFTTTATALSAVGTTYPIVPSLGGLASSNYTFTYVNGALTITKANLKVIAVNKSRVYGDANPSLTFVYNGFVNGDSTTTGAVTGQPTLSMAATTASPVGAYDILIGNGNLAATNYTFTFIKGSLAVNKALLTVTAANASRNYGAADPQFSLTYNGFKNGQTLATSGITGSAAVVSATTATSSVGNYPIEVSLGSLSSGNYDFAFVNGNLAINKALLRVIIPNASKVYGTNNPSFAYAYDGFVNNENELSAQITGAPLLTSSATSASGVGTYPITGVAGSLSAPNYDFTIVNGSLAITKAVLTATVDNKSRPYGVSNPEFTVSYNGFVNGDNALTIGLGGQILFTTLADLNSPQGQYDV
ncbi:MAG: MBG domain-containing protein, partial [Chitinophagaceae bacterium]